MCLHLWSTLLSVAIPPWMHLISSAQWTPYLLVSTALNSGVAVCLPALSVWSSWLPGDSKWASVEYKRPLFLDFHIEENQPAFIHVFCPWWSCSLFFKRKIFFLKEMLVFSCHALRCSWKSLQVWEARHGGTCVFPTLRRLKQGGHYESLRPPWTG